MLINIILENKSDYLLWKYWKPCLNFTLEKLYKSCQGHNGSSWNWTHDFFLPKPHSLTPELIYCCDANHRSTAQNHNILARVNYLCTICSVPPLLRFLLSLHFSSLSSSFTCYFAGNNHWLELGVDYHRWCKHCHKWRDEQICWQLYPRLTWTL